MVVVELAPLRYLHLASILGVSTAGMETATGRRRNWARDFSLELYGHVVMVEIEGWDCRKQGGSIRMALFGEQFPGRRHFNKPTKIHHRHDITNVGDDAEVMGDKQERKTALLLQ